MLRTDNITKYNPGTTERQTLHLAAYARIEFDRAFIAGIIHFSSHGDSVLITLVLHYVRIGNEKVVAIICDGAAVVIVRVTHRMGNGKHLCFVCRPRRLRHREHQGEGEDEME